MPAINSSDAERKFCLSDMIEVSSAKSVLINEMHSTNSTYFLKAGISSSDTNISKESNLYKLSSNLTLLESYKYLKDNWNGYGAKPFTSSFIERLKDIVIALEFSPKIFPTGRNSIQLEFEKKNGDYLEFEVYNSGEIHYYKTTKELEKEGKLSSKEINSYIRSFYAVR